MKISSSTDGKLTLLQEVTTPDMVEEEEAIVSAQCLA